MLGYVAWAVLTPSADSGETKADVWVRSAPSDVPRSSCLARGALLRLRRFVAPGSVPEDGWPDTGWNGGCARSASASLILSAPVMARGALWIAVLLAVASCSGGRSAEAVVATTFGHFAPAGSALVEETYQPRYDYTSGFVTTRNCGRLLRVFASNDIDAFLSAVLEAARQPGWQMQRVPAMAQPGAGYAVRLSGEQTVVTVVFYDFDHPTYRPLIYNEHTDGRYEGPLIDSKAWRFLVRMVVRDASDTGWSNCVDQARINPSF